MVYKCKVCGGALDVEHSNKNIVVCPYCGIQQTLPKNENDNVRNLYDRANHFLRKNEYDKAEAIYETILNEDTSDGEAYWSLVLCKYGVEYVKDPKTKKYVPTCNRTKTQSILSDEDYKKALENSTKEQQNLYTMQAKEINEIQKRILELSRKEKPYDVFICYKEKDNNGNRTEDSILAQDIYDKLESEGLRVFFARITLEDKLGVEYEPYIYAALNSAKVMIILGTSREYFESAWVKNEWSRYLSITKSDKDKIIIPCYKGMDAYDLPEEFAHLQAQDMGKIGFMQDLVRGIKKITGMYKGYGNIEKTQELQTQQKEDLYSETLNDLKTTKNTKVLGHLEKSKIYKKLARNFDKIGNYKDSGKYKMECAELSKKEKSIATKSAIKIIAIFTCVAMVISVLIVLMYVKPQKKREELLAKYNIAVDLYNNKDYFNAINAFKEIPDFEDSSSKIEQAKIKWRKSNSRVITSAYKGDTVYAVKKIGSVTVMGGSDVVQVTAYGDYILKLKNDGTVEGYCDNNSERAELTKDWTDICSISISPDYVYGVKNDGTVVYKKYDSSTDNNIKIDDWTNIIQLEPCLFGGVVGLKDDGTIVQSGVDRSCVLKLKEWKDIVQLSGTNTFLVGLKKDGELEYVSTTPYTTMDVKNEKSVIQLSKNYYDSNNIALVRADGSVVAYGNNSVDSCDITSWNDIVYLYGGQATVYGIKKDGTVTRAGGSYYSETDYWSGIRTDEEWRSVR